jgi:DNA-binding HxlR family transcriptional regulator
MVMVMMSIENGDSVRNQKINELIKKHKELDDTCIDIFLTLMAYKRMRFNELHRCLKKFGTDISKPSLIDHLNHLKKQKLISRKREDFQNVSYGLTDEIDSLLTVPEEEIKEWLENVIEEKVFLRSSDFYNLVTQKNTMTNSLINNWTKP